MTKQKKIANIAKFCGFVPAMLCASADKFGPDFVAGLPYWIEHTLRSDGFAEAQNEIKFDTRFFRMCPEWSRAARLLFLNNLIERAAPETRQPSPGWGYAPGSEPKHEEDEDLLCKIKVWNATCDPERLADRHFVGEFRIDLKTFRDKRTANHSVMNWFLANQKTNRLDATKAELEQMLNDTADEVEAFVVYVNELHDEIMDAVRQYEGNGNSK